MPTACDRFSEICPRYEEPTSWPGSLGSLIGSARASAIADDIALMFEEQVVPVCGSEIEKLFLASLEIRGREHVEDIRYKIHESQGNGEEYVRYVGGGNDTYNRLTVEPQKQFGQYRVDFFLSYSESGPAPDKHGWAFYIRDAIVECDGHDFHERTKEQARHDRSRDRHFTKLGFRVLRFTGSEIWKDPFACVDEVMSALAEDIWTKHDRHVLEAVDAA